MPLPFRAPEAWFARRMARWLSRMEYGTLRMIFPGGTEIEVLGTVTANPAAIIRIHRFRALRRMALDGDIGFADGYIAQDWSSDDLPALIELAARNRNALGPTLHPSALTKGFLRLLHAMRENSQKRAKRNIEAHYDLGNEFYALWLDQGMSYSSAIYRAPELTLEEAQEAKQDRILELMQAPRGGRVLEIGCGWGGLARRMTQAGLSVTGVTLSPAQLSYAKTQVPADLRLQDYRDLTGSFDRIVSIEMIEAVGRRFWPTYFGRLKRLLAPGGRVVLQAITIDEDIFEGYSREVDFIQRSIFPGGCLPTTKLIEQHFREAGLILRSAEHFGLSYARTLAEWRQRFLAAWPSIEAMGFPTRFRHLWEYYLAYCEGGFRAGTIGVGLYCAEHP